MFGFIDPFDIDEGGWGVPLDDARGRSVGGGGGGSVGSGTVYLTIEDYKRMVNDPDYIPNCNCVRYPCDCTSAVQPTDLNSKQKSPNVPIVSSSSGEKVVVVQQAGFELPQVIKDNPLIALGVAGIAIFLITR